MEEKNKKQETKVRRKTKNVRKKGGERKEMDAKG